MIIDRNIYAYSSPSEDKRKDRITRSYSIDSVGKTVGKIECIIYKLSNTAEITISMNHQVSLKWTCKNLVNDSHHYSCLVCPDGDEFDDFFLDIDKSRIGTVCDIQNSERFSQVTKVSKLAGASSFRLVGNQEDLPFVVYGNYSLLRMFECIFSILTLGIYRPINDDFMTGVYCGNLTAGEVRNLIIINSTMRMVFTAYDFSHE